MKSIKSKREGPVETVTRLVEIPVEVDRQVFAQAEGKSTLKRRYEQIICRSVGVNIDKLIPPKRSKPWSQRRPRGRKLRRAGATA